MKPVARLALATAAALGMTAAAYAIADSPRPPAEALGPEPVTIVVDIEHSRFEPSYLRVVAGTEVRFVLTNGDPINHELIVGPPDVHRRHEGGNHAEHPAVPGELSVGPDGQGATSYLFDAPGTVEMACHLPGHYAFGMHGEIDVVPRDER